MHPALQPVSQQHADADGIDRKRPYRIDGELGDRLVRFWFCRSGSGRFDSPLLMSFPAGSSAVTNNYFGDPFPAAALSARIKA